MKRAHVVSVAVLGLLLLQPGAQQPVTGSEPSPSPVLPIAAEHLEWETLDTGVQVIRIWRHFAKVSDTEIALMRLSNARHDEFQKLGMEFINRYEVFTRPINHLTPCTAEVREGAPSERDELYWDLWLPHWPDSFCFCRSHLDWAP